MAANTVEAVANQGRCRACAPQGSPKRSASAKAENSLARRIALQDKFATGVLFAIVAADLRVAVPAYRVHCGERCGQLFDVSFSHHAKSPEHLKEGGRHSGLEPLNLVLFVGAHVCLFALLIALGGAGSTLLSTLRRTT